MERILKLDKSQIPRYYRVVITHADGSLLINKVVPLLDTEVEGFTQRITAEAHQASKGSSVDIYPA